MTTEFELLENQWNEVLEQPSAASATVATPILDEAAAMFRSSLYRQLYHSDQDPTKVLRLSALGRPAIELFARHFHPEWFTLKPSRRLTQLFHTGDTWEASFYVHLYQLGWNVVETQRNVTWNGVAGHTDFIVESPKGKRYLLELKTCATNKFNNFSQGKMIPQAYWTQLGAYREVLHNDGVIDGAAWVFYCKETSDISVFAPDPERFASSLDRAEAILEVWRDVVDGGKTWEDVFHAGVYPPPPRPEIYKGKATGNYLIPQDLDKALVPHVYQTTIAPNNYNKPVTYALDYLLPEGVERISFEES